MPFLRAFLCLFLFCWPVMSQAGPWMRGDGETFLSFSIETEFERGITDGSELYGSIYAEHGLTDRLTLGLDASTHKNALSKTIGFLRWPVGSTDRTLRMAAEFGLGTEGDTFAMRPGFSIGRGLQAGDTPGWITVDSRAIFVDSFDGRLDTDITLGLKPNDRTKLMVQLQTGLPWNGDAYAKLAPSYAHEITPGRHIEVGFVAGVAEADDFKLKIGFWHKF